MPEQIAVNPSCPLTGKLAGRKEGREDGGRKGLREAVAVTEPRSREAPGTVLVGFINQERKPDPGEILAWLQGAASPHRFKICISNSMTGSRVC